MSETATDGGSILARTAKGAGWVIGWRMFTRGLGLVSTLVLVRLLRPSDFGLVTLATSFSQAIDQLSALGVEEAVIRDPHADRTLYNTAFTINFLRGLATAAVLAAVAWPVGRFFGDVRLAPVMLAIAASALVNACENIGIVEFRRDMAFQMEFLMMLLPRVAGIVVAIGMAWLWRSYWALIAAIVCNTSLRVAMGYALHPFRPRLSLSAWRRIAGFSFWSWLLALSTMVRDRCDAFVIGRALNITKVGIFSVGAEIGGLPILESVYPLTRACFSAFALVRRSGNTGEAADTFLRVLAASTLVALPASVGLSLVADPVVALAFGARWQGATPVIEILGVGLSVMIPGLIAASLLSAYGRLRETFAIQLAAVVVRVPLAIGLVTHLGLPGAALAAVAGTMVEQLLYTRLAMRQVGLRVADVLAGIWPPVLATATMAAGLSAAGLGWSPLAVMQPSAAAARLLVAVPAGALLYLVALAVLWLLRGRPHGAERDTMDVLWRMLRSAGAMLRRPRTALPTS